MWPSWRAGSYATTRLTSPRHIGCARSAPSTLARAASASRPSPPRAARCHPSPQRLQPLGPLSAAERACVAALNALETRELPALQQELERQRDKAEHIAADASPPRVRPAAASVGGETALAELGADLEVRSPGQGAGATKCGHGPCLRPARSPQPVRRVCSALARIQDEVFVAEGGALS